MDKLQYKNCYKDAGLYRQWIVQEYGKLLLHGGPGHLMSKGIKHVKRLASITDKSFEIVLKDIQEDITKR